MARPIHYIFYDEVTKTWRMACHPSRTYEKDQVRADETRSWDKRDTTCRTCVGTRVYRGVRQ